MTVEEAEEEEEEGTNAGTAVGVGEIGAAMRLGVATAGALRRGVGPGGTVVGW